MRARKALRPTWPREDAALLAGEAAVKLEHCWTRWCVVDDLCYMLPLWGGLPHHVPLPTKVLLVTLLKLHAQVVQDGKNSVREVR